MRKDSILPAIFIMIASIFLHGCVSSDNNYNAQPWPKEQSTTAEQTPNNLSVGAVERQSLDAPIQGEAHANNALSPVKVALLLPLSGQHKKLGQAMLNAAQMALFDIAHDNFEIITKDTMGTPNGARIAARAAIQDGAKLVIGPIFSPSVKAARQVTSSANINMIAFSTDWRLANSKTFLIGFLPFDQIERVISYATNAGYGRIGVLSPQDNYGNAVVSAYQAISHNINIDASHIERFSTQGRDLGSVVRRFSNYDARKAAVEMLEDDDPNKNIANNRDNAPFDAVLMPVGGTIARQVGSFLSHYDLPPRTVKRLGTGLMDDATLASDKSLEGAWFAAPPPQSRQKFERRYNSIYYAKPPRIASLAYDATALAAILARTGLERNNRPAFDHRSITNSNGFAGVDGIFRFRPDGIVERGLAVLEYKKGSIVVIDKAPRTFQRRRF